MEISFFSFQYLSLICVSLHMMLDTFSRRPTSSLNAEKVMRKNDDFSSRRGGNKNDYVGLLELRYSRFKEYEKVGGVSNSDVNRE